MNFDFVVLLYMLLSIFKANYNAKECIFAPQIRKNNIFCTF